MKITRKGPEALTGTNPVPGDARGASASTARAGGSESISLSSLSTQLASQQLNAGEAPVNAEQVERIKQAIREGAFTVNAEAVADKLLELDGGRLVRERRP